MLLTLQAYHKAPWVQKVKVNYGLLLNWVDGPGHLSKSIQPRMYTRDLVQLEIEDNKTTWRKKTLYDQALSVDATASTVVMIFHCYYYLHSPHSSNRDT